MNDPDLYGVTDAAVWAAEFCRRNPPSSPAPGEGTMIGWFANAIESGREASNSRMRELEAAIGEVRGAIIEADKYLAQHRCVAS